MDKKKIKDNIFIIVPIVLMVLVDFFGFINRMTLVWKSPVDNVIFSSIPVSFLFLILAVFFYKQTNDEKYRDRNEEADPADPRKIRMSTKGKIYLLIGTFVFVFIVSSVVSAVCSMVYTARRQHDNEIIRALGDALKDTYDYYAYDSNEVKSDKQIKSYEAGFQKLSEGADVFTWTELTSDTKEKDSFEDKLEQEFKYQLQQGSFDYILKEDKDFGFADLEDKLFFADKDSELYVYMTDSVFVVGITNPRKSLDKKASKVSTKIVIKGGLPELLFYVVDDSESSSHNTLAVDTFGQIFESVGPQNDSYKLDSYVDYLSGSTFYYDFRKVGDMDDFEIYEIYQLFTSDYSVDTHSFKGDKDEFLKRLDKEFAEGFKRGYDSPYNRPVSEEVSITEMNVIGVYCQGEYYSITNGKLWGNE